MWAAVLWICCIFGRCHFCRRRRVPMDLRCQKSIRRVHVERRGRKPSDVFSPWWLDETQSCMIGNGVIYHHLRSVVVEWNLVICESRDEDVHMIASKILWLLPFPGPLCNDEHEEEMFCHQRRWTFPYHMRSKGLESSSHFCRPWWKLLCRTLWYLCWNQWQLFSVWNWLSDGRTSGFYRYP